MAKRHESRHKVSRRFGIDIYGTGGDALQRKLAVPPGGTRRGRRRRSTFGVQLLEKQKAKALYGVLEGQFRRYVKEAARQPGDTSENLLRLLERRLDNVVYGLGFARAADGTATREPRTCARPWPPGQHPILSGAARRDARAGRDRCTHADGG